MMSQRCKECDTEVVESSSERGHYYCVECSSPRRYGECYRWDTCPCCHREGTEGTYPGGAMCDDCEDAGCHVEIFACTYRQSTTEPSECDHLYYHLPFEGDIARCAWCAHEVEDPEEVGL